eukprot:1879929-Alexandrium_andersonii.AAC.1
MTAVSVYLLVDADAAFAACLNGNPGWAGALIAAGDFNCDLSHPRDERDAAVAAAVHGWAVRRGLVAVGADGPTRRSLRGGAPSKLDWAA